MAKKELIELSLAYNYFKGMALENIPLLTLKLNEIQIKRVIFSYFQLLFNILDKSKGISLRIVVPAFFYISFEQKLQRLFSYELIVNDINFLKNLDIEPYILLEYPNITYKIYIPLDRQFKIALDWDNRQ